MAPYARQSGAVWTGVDDAGDSSPANVRERALRQQLSRHIVRYRSLAARPRAWLGGCFATSLASSRHSARFFCGAFKVSVRGVAHPVRNPRPISGRSNVRVTRGIGVSALEWNLDHLHHPLLCPKLYQNRRLTRLTKSADDPNGMKLSSNAQLINELCDPRRHRVAVSWIGSVFDGAG